MKKILLSTSLFFAMVLFSTLGMAQVLITQIYEGTSGNNKFIEITNLGSTSVDLTNPQYTLKLYSNKAEIGTNTATKTYNITGTINPGQSILIRHTLATTPSYAITYTPFDSTTTVTSFNGAGTGTPIANTDIIGLYLGTTLVDVFAWGTFQYNDQSFYRNLSVTQPNPTWTLSEWTSVTDLVVNAALPNTIERLGYHGSGSTDTTLIITSPVNNSNVPSPDVNIAFSVLNFIIGAPGTSGVSGHIHYTIDGGSVVEYNTTSPIALTGLGSGSHTVILTLVDNSHNLLNPSVADTVVFTVTTSTVVANIGALRASTADGSTVYRLTGQAVLTFKQTSRSQKYIQDATGGVLIDDPNSVITTVYNIGDNITNVVGTLTNFNGMLEFTPVMDPGAAISTGNTITPIDLSLTDFNTPATFLSHQAQLVKLTGVTFQDANGTLKFTNGIGYKITNSADSFFTNFYSVDYINQIVPATTVNIIGILGTRLVTGNFITARNIADIEGMSSVVSVAQDGNMVISPNPVNNNITFENIKGVDKIVVNTIIGSTVKTYTNIAGANFTVSMSDLKAGIYTATLYKNNQVVKSVRFVKE